MLTLKVTEPISVDEEPITDETPPVNDIHPKLSDIAPLIKKSSAETTTEVEKEKSPEPVLPPFNSQPIKVEGEPTSQSFSPKQ